MHFKFSTGCLKIGVLTFLTCGVMPNAKSRRKREKKRKLFPRDCSRTAGGGSKKLTNCVQFRSALH